MEIDYYSKYLKYKNKYVQLKQQIGGLDSLDAEYHFSNCLNGKLDIKNTEETYDVSGSYEKNKDNNNFNINFETKDDEINIKNYIGVDKNNVCSNICSRKNKKIQKHFFSFDDSCNKEIKNIIKKEECNYKNKKSPPVEKYKL
jgi:hypothetical protein